MSQRFRIDCAASPLDATMPSEYNLDDVSIYRSHINRPELRVRFDLIEERASIAFNGAPM